MKDEKMPKDAGFQNPHRTNPADGRFLEEAIGREVKRFRVTMGLTIAELAKAADLPEKQEVCAT